MIRALRLLALLVVGLGLSACYQVDTLVVERNDDEAAAAFAGAYYRFDALPETVADWRAFKGKWEGEYEIVRDPHAGLYFLHSKDKGGARSPSNIARAQRLNGQDLLVQMFQGSDRTFVIVVRRDANGVIRAMKPAATDEAALRKRHGIKASASVWLMDENDDALPREQIVRFLGDAAALKSTTWPILLVPQQLVDN